MFRETYAEIDLNAVSENVKNTLLHIGSSMLMAVVKADAYGHGSVNVAKTALKAGAKWLAVACAEEGEVLRKSGISAPVLILSISNSSQIELAIKEDISICAASKNDIFAVLRKCEELKKTAKVHIKIDSGMGRIGLCDISELNEILDILKDRPEIAFEGIFTHFAKADYVDKSFTETQLEKFSSFVNTAKSAGFTPLVHCANSAAIVDLKESHFDMVRLGISLYGYYPSKEVIKENVKYMPAMTVKTKIVFLKDVKAGTGIGYGLTYTTEKDSRIATLPVGYGDGYNRLLSNKGRVIVISGGKSYYADIVGRVCMDQTMIDVTHIPDIKLGDEVILLGRYEEKHFDADDMAEICGTISYEILLDFNYRVPRFFIGNDE